MAIDGQFFENIKDMSIEQLVVEEKNIPNEMMPGVETKAMELCSSHHRCKWLGINYYEIDDNAKLRAR